MLENLSGLETLLLLVMIENHRRRSRRAAIASSCTWQGRVATAQATCTVLGHLVALLLVLEENALTTEIVLIEGMIIVVLSLCVSSHAETDKGSKHDNSNENTGNDSDNCASGDASV